MPHIMMTRYAQRQQLLHWLTALLMFTILPVSWVLVSVVEESRPFFGWMDLHESLGLALLTVTVVRLALRAFDSAPAADPRTPGWMTGIASCVHWGLLMLMILMPVSGYVWANGHGHDVAPFNVVQLPRIAFGRREIGDVAEWVHELCQWMLYVLLALHLGGVAYHVAVARDGGLDRMLPPQRSCEHAMMRRQAPPLRDNAR